MVLGCIPSSAGCRPISSIEHHHFLAAASGRTYQYADIAMVLRKHLVQTKVQTSQTPSSLESQIWIATHPAHSKDHVGIEHLKQTNACHNTFLEWMNVG